jgi:hypothetical protein
MAKDPYSNINTVTGEHYYAGGDTGNSDPVASLLASGQYRDTSRQTLGDYYAGKISQEAALSQIKGTPLFARSAEEKELNCQYLQQRLLINIM